MGGKKPTFVTLFLPEYISDQAVDLLPPDLETSCLCLKAHPSLIETIGTVKNMSKFFPLREIIGSQGVSFSRKKWGCPIGENLDTFLGRIALIAAHTPRISSMSLIEQGDTSHRMNQSSVQPEPSAVIYLNGGSQLDTPTLTEETDKRTFSEEASGSDSGSEPDPNSLSGSDSRSESPSESDILSGKSSVLPSQNNLSESRKDQIAPKKASL